MDAFRNNIVSENYETKKQAKDLRIYNKPKNKKFLKDLMNDPARVRTEGEMKIWLGTTVGGYPQISSKELPVRPKKEKAKRLQLHRLVYECFKKHAPVNACICHKSNNKRNINPEDLFEGTYSDNSLHAIITENRTYPRGEQHWSAKVTSNNITEILNNYYARVQPIYKIAEKFGLSRGYTSRLIHGHSRYGEVRIAREEVLSNK